MPEVVTTIADLRQRLAPLRANGIAIVPTMGALHAGHLALVEEAQARTGHMVVSIFVNPAQFAPHEDFDAYPRTLEADLAKLPDQITVFAPTVREMYPDGHATSIAVGGPSAGLETDYRPHFFGGVATVVAKLLIAALPDIAIFGEKDYQQLLVVKQMVRDLALPVTIIGAPTSRESDGLALSSRNAYLSMAERRTAAQLNVILKKATSRARDGDLRAAEGGAVEALYNAGFDHVDYVAIRDAQTLDHIAHLGRPARILAAAKIGKTRLIDNMAI